jgi:hypothetical protein
MVFILIFNGDPSSMCSTFTLRSSIYRSTFEPCSIFLHVLLPWNLFSRNKVSNITYPLLHALLLLAYLSCHLFLYIFNTTTLGPKNSKQSWSYSLFKLVNKIYLQHTWKRIGSKNELFICFWPKFKLWSRVKICEGNAKCLVGIYKSSSFGGLKDLMSFCDFCALYPC